MDFNHYLLHTNDLSQKVNAAEIQFTKLFKTPLPFSRLKETLRDLENSIYNKPGESRDMLCKIDSTS